MARHAIYLVPAPETPLAAFATDWLGRVPPGVDAALHARAVGSPAMYGFHATLKAPFRLAAGAGIEDLGAAAEAVAARHSAFALPDLSLARMRTFLALVPAAPSPEIDALAADCVEAFDPFRAPPSPDEIARRRDGGLTPRQDALLTRWGYPYVMEEFRLHFSLASGLAEDELATLAAALESTIPADCLTGVAVDAITLCVQEDEAGGPFRAVRRFALK